MTKSRDKLAEINPSYKRVSRNWQCSICSKKFTWNEQSKWFGQLEDEKGMENIEMVMCSDECFDKAKPLLLDVNNN